jgi:hypothetical protein
LRLLILISIDSLSRMSAIKQCRPLIIRKEKTGMVPRAATQQSAVRLIAVTALLLSLIWMTTGCESIQAIAPAITDIQAPAGRGSSISSSARLDKKGWGYHDIYFSFADTPEDVFSPAATTLEPNCQVDAADASVKHCTVQGHAGLGAHYFQRRLPVRVPARCPAIRRAARLQWGSSEITTTNSSSISATSSARSAVSWSSRSNSAQAGV